MDLADRAQMDEARAQHMSERLALRQVATTTAPHTHCEECGMALTPSRLAAMPNAQRCVPCETEHESLQARGLA